MRTGAGGLPWTAQAHAVWKAGGANFPFTAGSEAWGARPPAPWQGTMPEKELPGPEPVAMSRIASYRREAPLLAGEAGQIPVPVPVIRLPRGPDGTGRGFRAARGRDPTGSAEVAEQQARAALRERYLRSILAMVGRPVHFTLHERVQVDAHFGATDLDVANFHVSALQTPLGVQGEALLRCADIISYSFQL